MARVLITGMSGTGKSTALAELARRGHRVIDADLSAWNVEVTSPAGSGAEQLWRQDAMDALLAQPVAGWLFVAGCASNQGSFYDRFDAVVLLSAPADVLLDRISSRTTNDYGKSREERELILTHLREIEPLLRATCTHEIDATQPLSEVVERLVTIGGDS